MRRVVRSLIRIIAAGLVGFGIIEIAFEFARHRANGTEFNSWHLILGAVLILGGIVLFAASTKLAKKLTADFDE